MYARDLAGTKFSPLNQINADNVAKLAPAWNVTLVERPAGQGRGARGGGAPPAGEEAAAAAGGRGRGPAAPQILSNPEVTPIVVNGVMYLNAGGDHIMALDAATGKEIWRYQIPNGDTTGRGVAYWPGDRNNPERIIFTASPVNVKAGGGGFNSGAVESAVPADGARRGHRQAVRRLRHQRRRRDHGRMERRAGRRQAT